jgi:predicted methyltransferase
MARNIHAALIVGFATLAAACNGLNPVASEDLARGAGTAGTVSTQDVFRPGSSVAIEKAVARSEETRRDARLSLAEQRQAPLVLEFFAIQPGMTVLDLYSAGGIYTNLLAYIVGERGRVVVHNNTPYVDFARAQMQSVAQDRADNIELLASKGDTLILAPGRFDAALIMLAYQDVYYVDDGEWLALDGDELLADLYQAMRPGAVLGVIEHASAAAADPDPGRQRRSPAQVQAALEAAGFRYEKHSDVLSPVNQDPTSTIRSRAVMRFRKPWSQ